MRGNWKFVLPLFLILTCFSPQVNGVSIMPVEDIKEGMEGTGRTVFKGVEVEEFKVKILGVLKKVLPGGRDIILARASGGPLETTGIIAGMSGSPVYIDNKLIGALAYGWGFSKEPICGITPIQDMLDSISAPLNPRPASATADGSGRRAPEADGLGPSLDPSFKGIRRVYPAGLKGVGRPILVGLKPLGLFLMVNGMEERVFPRLKDSLSSWNLTPVLGGGSVSNGLNPQIIPGSAVGLQLMSGDMELTAVGTVTYCDGDKVLALGHPFVLLGETDLPMTTAYVHTVLPSQEFSFKLASAVDIVGRFDQDRAFAVGGKLREMPHMIDAGIRIEEPRVDYRKDYRVQVIDNRIFTPILLSQAVESALIAHEGMFSDNTLRFRYQVNLSGYPSLEREDLFYSGMDLSGFVYQGGINMPLEILLNNNIEEVKLENVRYEVSIIKGRQTARIERVYFSRAYVEPGEVIKAGVILKAYGGEEIEKKFDLKIPEDAIEGEMRLGFGGGMNLVELESALGIVPEESALFFAGLDGKSQMDSVSRIMKLIREEKKNTDLVAVISLPRRRLDVWGEKLSALPSSFIEVLTSPNSSGAVIEPMDEFRFTVPADHIITNYKILSLNVTKRKVKR